MKLNHKAHLHEQSSSYTHTQKDRSPPDILFMKLSYIHNDSCTEQTTEQFLDKGCDNEVMTLIP